MMNHTEACRVRKALSREIRANCGGTRSVADLIDGSYDWHIDSVLSINARNLAIYRLLVDHGQEGEATEATMAGIVVDGGELLESVADAVTWLGY